MEALKLSGWVEVFRTGTWNGQFYGKDYLQAMKKNFDEKVAKVSAIIGHTSFFGDEKPALAWVQQLRVRGNRLDVRFQNVQPELREAVLTGRYLNRSIEHYHDYNGHGPTLVAVAFLGGSAPAVDGMEDCEQHFEAADGRLMMSREGKAVIVFDASKRPEEERWDEGAFDGEGEPEKEQAGAGGQGDQQEAAVTDAEKKKLIEDTLAAFKESAEFKGLVAKAEKSDELEGQLTATQTKALEDGVKAFVKGLLEKKKLTPALEQMGLETALIELEKLTGGQKVKFGAEERTLPEFFKTFIGSILDASKLFVETKTGDPEDPEEPGQKGMSSEEDAKNLKKPLTFSLVQ